MSKTATMTLPPRRKRSTAPPKLRDWRAPRTAGEFFVLAVLVLMAAVTMVPFFVMITSALRTPAEAVPSNMWDWPTIPSGAGFTEAWGLLQNNVLNSFLVVVPASLLTSFVGAFNGFVFSKLKFRGSNLIFTLILIGMFIPYQAVLIPLVRFLSATGLYGTIPGLILTHFAYGIPIATLIFRNYYASLPKELIEAAQIDGATNIQVFTRVALPLSVPGFIVSILFQFTSQWNNFLFGLIVVPDPKMQVATVALNNMSGSLTVEWNVVMAGAALIAIPTLVLYLTLSRYFVRGLLAGSVK